MHEMSLMAGVFDAIESSLAAYNYVKVTRVKLQVGKLTNAEPAALEFAFQAFAQGSKTEGAELEIEEVPVQARCHSCRGVSEMLPLQFQCPKCKSLEIEIIKGRELVLECLEVEQ